MSNRKKKREDRLYQTLRNTRRGERKQDKAADELRAMQARQVDAMVDEVKVKES